MKVRTRLAVARLKHASVGLDISLSEPGICVAFGNAAEKVGPALSVETASIRAGKELRGPQRLSVVTQAVLSWMRTRDVLKPGVLVVTEGYGFGTYMAHSLGEVGGCVRRELYEAGCNLLIIPPSSLKKYLTGKGVGDKAIVMKHVLRRWGFDVDNDNQTDAFGCAVVGLLEQDPSNWNAAETEMLTRKVERYAGKGQDGWGVQPDSIKPVGRKRKGKPAA